MKRNIFLILILFFSLRLWSKEYEIEFKKGKLKIGGKTLQVEIAETELQQAYGLMFRKSMPENHGMIFIFKDSVVRRFWMKNTLIPLSIAYFDEKQTLVDIIDMKPVRSVKSVLSVEEDQLPSYPSSAPAMYALEVNQGWFKKNKIVAPKLGTKSRTKFQLDRL